MSNEPINKYSGLNVSEDIDLLPGSLEVDAVAMMSIFPRGADSFGLSGEALEDFGCRCILTMLNAGASVVWPTGRGSWRQATEYRGTNEQIAHQIVDEWKRGKMDEKYDGVWFSLPPFEMPHGESDS